MEDGLGAHIILMTRAGAVLILVLVEDGLGGVIVSNIDTLKGGLNPCFSGGWSRRPIDVAISAKTEAVLILVLVEDGLGDSNLYKSTLHK